jgi:hypothetical protein
MLCEILLDKDARLLSPLGWLTHGRREERDEMKLCSNLSSFCTTHVSKELCKGVDEKERKKSLEGKRVDKRICCCILTMTRLTIARNSCNGKKIFIPFFFGLGGGVAWAIVF